MDIQQLAVILMEAPVLYEVMGAGWVWGGDSPREVNKNNFLGGQFLIFLSEIPGK